MQATLSNIASGKIFRNRPSTVTSTHLSRHHLTTSQPLATVYAPESFAPQIAEGPGLAHDAGNLLGALGLYCDLLASPGVLRDEHRHYAEELQLLSGRSRDLIDRLLNPASANSRSGIRGALSAHPRPRAEQVVVPDVIEGCRGLLNAVARRAVAVAYGVGAALPVAVSREALERILVNLTKNAAEALDSDLQGAITLRVVCEPGKGDLRRIVLTVEDKGRGMNSAAVKVLTTPLPSSATRPGPRGLGFQVVRELVGASGGQLRLRSQDEGINCGTTVEVTWLVAAIEAHPRTPAEKRTMILVAAPKMQTTSIAGRASC